MSIQQQTLADNAIATPVGRVYFDVQGQIQGLEGVSTLSGVSHVWVPTQKLLLTQAVVPGKKRAQWMQALPYAFEEQLAQPIDALFFKVFARDAQGMTQVAVIEKSQMQHWVDTLQVAGLAHAQLIPDCFQLSEPNQDGVESNIAVETPQWVAASDGETTWVRTGKFSGFAGSESWLRTLKNIREKQGQTPVLTKRVWDDVVPSGLTPLAAKQLGLREGIYQTKSPRQSAWRCGWSPAIAASLLLAVWLGNTVLETRQLDAQREQLDQQTTRLFQQMFPNVKRIVNLKAQTKSALAQGETSSVLGPIEIAQTVEALLVSSPKIQVQRLGWRAQELQIELQAESVQSLQAIEQQLKLNKAYRVRLDVQKLDASQVTARLVIHV